MYYSRHGTIIVALAPSSLPMFTLSPPSSTRFTEYKPSLGCRDSPLVVISVPIGFLLLFTVHVTFIHSPPVQDHPSPLFYEQHGERQKSKKKNGWMDGWMDGKYVGSFGTWPRACSLWCIWILLFLFINYKPLQ